jgi:hypothetical protein
MRRNEKSRRSKISGRLSRRKHSALSVGDLRVLRDIVVSQAAGLAVEPDLGKKGLVSGQGFVANFRVALFWPAGVVNVISVRQQDRTTCR